jgi:hypothetical protein
MEIINIILAFYLIMCIFTNAYVFININKNEIMAFRTFIQLKCMFFGALVSKILQFVLLCMGYTTMVSIIVPLDLIGGMLNFAYIEYYKDKDDRISRLAAQIYHAL